MVLIDGTNVHTRSAYRNNQSANDTPSLVKPSDLIGSMKRSLGRRPKCQCKHHQKKLLQKQEEQRQKLREQILSQQSSSNQQDHLVQLQIPSQNVSVTKTSSSHKFRALNNVYGTAKYTKRNILPYVFLLIMALN